MLQISVEKWNILVPSTRKASVSFSVPEKKQGRTLPNIPTASSVLLYRAGACLDGSLVFQCLLTRQLWAAVTLCSSFLIIITWQSRAGRQSWNSTVCSGQDWDVLAEIVEKQTEGRWLQRYWECFRGEMNLVLAQQRWVLQMELAAYWNFWELIFQELGECISDVCSVTQFQHEKARSVEISQFCSNVVF